jgi:hypothetical protein
MLSFRKSSRRLAIMQTPTPPGVQPPPSNAIKQYLDRVKELVPTEVTAAFLAINSAIPLDSDYLKYLYWFFGVLVVACWLYLRFQGVQKLQQLAFITLIAFPVWAFNIAMSRFDFIVGLAFIPGCILILVTLFSPLVAGPK